jgi:hypothetical protein
MQSKGISQPRLQSHEWKELVFLPDCLHRPCLCWNYMSQGWLPVRGIICHKVDYQLVELYDTRLFTSLWNYVTRLITNLWNYMSQDCLPVCGIICHKVDYQLVELYVTRLFTSSWNYVSQGWLPTCGIICHKVVYQFVELYVTRLITNLSAVLLTKCSFSVCLHTNNWPVFNHRPFSFMGLDSRW